MFIVAACVVGAVLLRLGSEAALVISNTYKIGRSGKSTQNSLVVPGNSTGNYYMAFATDGVIGASNMGGRDIVLQSFSASGTVRWTKQFGTAGIDTPNDLVVGPDGNIYLVGRCAGLAGSGTYGGGDDGCYYRMDPFGNILCSGNIGGSSNDYAMGVAVDASAQYFYIVGETSSASINGVSKNGGFSSSFWIKYDTATCTVQTTYLPSFALNGYNGFKSIALDSSGNSWVTGISEALSAGVTFYGTGTSKGGIDVIIAKISPTGSVLWGDCVGGTGNDYTYNIMVAKIFSS